MGKSQNEETKRAVEEANEVVEELIEAVEETIEELRNQMRNEKSLLDAGLCGLVAASRHELGSLAKVPPP